MIIELAHSRAMQQRDGAQGARVQAVGGKAMADAEMDERSGTNVGAEGGLVGIRMKGSWGRGRPTMVT